MIMRLSCCKPEALKRERGGWEQGGTMHPLARGAAHRTAGDKGRRGLGWGPPVGPTSRSSGRRTWAWQPQAVSGGICGGGGIWKVQRVRKQSGVIGGGRQPQTPGM